MYLKKKRSKLNVQDWPLLHYATMVYLKWPKQRARKCLKYHHVIFFVCLILVSAISSIGFWKVKNRVQICGEGCVGVRWRGENNTARLKKMLFNFNIRKLRKLSRGQNEYVFPFVTSFIGLPRGGISLSKNPLQLFYS